MTDLHTFENIIRNWTKTFYHPEKEKENGHPGLGKEPVHQG